MPGLFHWMPHFPGWKGQVSFFLRLKHDAKTMNFKVLSFLWFYAFHSSYRGKVQVCFVADGRRIPELAHQSVHQSFLVFYIFTQYSPVLEKPRVRTPTHGLPMLMMPNACHWLRIGLWMGLYQKSVTMCVASFRWRLWYFSWYSQTARWLATI